MKKALLLLVYCLGMVVGRAQHFSNLYYDNHPYATFNSIEEYNGSIYTSGMTAQIDTPQYYKGLFAKIGNDGSLNYFKTVADTLPNNCYLYWNNLKKTADGNFIAVGEKWDSLYKIFLTKMDTAGNILLWREYSYPNVNIFQAHDVVEIPGQGYLIVINAHIISPSNSEVIVLRTDTSGNLLNTTVHNHGAAEFPWLVRPMLNGHFIVGAVNMSPGSLFWSKTWLLEIDSMGELVNQWLDSDATNLWPRSMQQTADSGWIVVRPHLAYNVSGVQAFNASILKLDKYFNKEWEIDSGGIYDDAGMYAVEILPDGDYVCAGANPVNVTVDSAHMYGWLMKVSQTGEVLWSKNYLADTHYGTFNYLYDVEVLPNGDLLACGELRFTFDVGIRPIQKGWILRTDSNGCVIDNCWLSIDDRQQTEDINLSIYPNPATDHLNISIDESMVGAQLNIYNTTGALVQSNQLNTQHSTLITSTLPAGIYIAEVKTKEASVKKRWVKM